MATTKNIERLVLSIATNQFTVPLPSGKDVIRAVNALPLLEEIIQHFENDEQKCLCYKAMGFAIRARKILAG